MKPFTSPLIRRSLQGTAAAAFTLLLAAPCLSGEQPAAPEDPGAVGLHRIALGAPLLQPGAPEPPQNNNAPIKDDLFAGTEKFAKNAIEANEVNMDPDALGDVQGDNAARAHRTVLNVVHHYEYDKPGMYNPADVDEFRRKLEGPDWHCSVHSRDLKSGESTDICSRRRAPDLIEKAIITVEPKELTFIHQIRHANGEGGALDGLSMPGMGMVPGTSSYYAALGAEIKAEALASTAELRAEMPFLAEGLYQFHGAGPDLSGLLHGNPTLGSFKFTPEQQKQLDKLKDQMHFNLNEQMKHFKQQQQNLQQQQLYLQQQLGNATP